MIFKSIGQILISLKRREILAISAAAIMGCVMYPTVLFGAKLPDLGILAWIHLVPLLIVVQNKTAREQALLVFVTLFCCYVGNLYWLYVAMRHYGGLGFFAAMPLFLLLMVFLAAVKSLFLCAALWAQKKGRLSLTLVIPIFLTVFDYVLHVQPAGGFPWSMPAYSQGQWMMFLQWVSFTGAFAVGLMIYLVNALIAEGWMYFSFARGIDKSIARFFGVFGLCLLSLYVSFLSSQDFEKKQQRAGEINVGLIQAAIRQDQKWSRDNLRRNLRLHEELTSQVIRDGAELVLWPESAYPYRLTASDLRDGRFLDYEQMRVPLFVGAVVSDSAGNDESAPLRNSVLHVDENARFVAQYSKMHLVPFGEYVPLKNWLTFVDNLTAQVGTFTPGEAPVLFHVKGIAFGSLICYEDVFLDVAREFAKAGAQVLVNYTNDAWYENSSAQYQHLVMSQFRALENRKPLLRVTNTGYTAAINARGEIVDELKPFRTTYLMHRLEVISQTSFFTKHGYSWILALEIALAVILVYAYVRHRLRSHKIR